MALIAQILIAVINIYIFIMIAMIIMSWLLSFNVLNARSRWVAQLWYGLNALTEPVLGPVRRLLPPMGGLDFSPIVVFLGLSFIVRALAPYAAG